MPEGFSIARVDFAMTDDGPTFGIISEPASASFKEFPSHGTLDMSRFERSKIALQNSGGMVICEPYKLKRLVKSNLLQLQHSSDMRKNNSDTRKNDRQMYVFIDQQSLCSW